MKKKLATLCVLTLHRARHSGRRRRPAPPASSSSTSVRARARSSCRRQERRCSWTAVLPEAAPRSARCSTRWASRRIDYTVLTHYHIDHDSGLIELLNAGRVAGIAYDNGDGPDVQPPGTSTASNSTRGTYLNYVTATGHAGVTRQTIVAGQVIDLGGGMRATASRRWRSSPERRIGRHHQRRSEHREHQPARRVQQLRLHRLGRSHRRRQHEHGEDARRGNVRRPARRRRGRHPAQSSRQHDHEQPGVPVGREGRSRCRPDRARRTRSATRTARRSTST